MKFEELISRKFHLFCAVLLSGRFDYGLNNFWSRFCVEFAIFELCVSSSNNSKSKPAWNFEVNNITNEKSLNGKFLNVEGDITYKKSSIKECWIVANNLNEIRIAATPNLTNMFACFPASDNRLIQLSHSNIKGNKR